MRIITTHRNTDFDGLASVYAASLLFPEAEPVLPPAMNPNVKAFLSIHKDIFDAGSTADIDLSSVRKLIVVDTCSWNRIDGGKTLRKIKDLEIILWDHHAGPGDIDANWRCHEAVGATTTLLMRRLREEKKVITPIHATLFLAGIYEDTGNLTFPSSRADDAYAAAYLLEKNADLAVINSFLRPAYGEAQKGILFKMLQSARREKIGSYTVCIHVMPISKHVESLSLVVRMYREVLNVDAAFGIFHDKARDKCMVIARSGVEELNVGEIMRALGGGGHPGAGSAVLKSTAPEVIRKMIAAEITGNRKAVGVADLMSYPVVSVPPDTPMSIVAGLLRKNGVTGLPVVENERLVGVISRRDFRKLKKETHLSRPVKAFMNTRVLTVQLESNPIQAAKVMVKHDIGRLPVVDEKNRMVGIVTRSDVMRYFYDLVA